MDDDMCADVGCKPSQIEYLRVVDGLPEVDCL